MKIVMIGAGSAQFGLSALGDIFQSKLLQGSQIVLVDIDGEALNKVYSIAQNFVNQHALPFELQASTKREAVLHDADAVLISIEVGNRFQLWNEDWSIPQQFGISQIYGENGGVGGIFHALRIVPVILDICEDIIKYCPEAYVFNYSNPMTAISTTVLRKYPKLNFIGMCHEIASLERYIPAILGTDFDNLSLRAGGLNHFSVLLEAKYNDSKKDAYPDILAKAPTFFKEEPGYSDLLDYARKNGKLPHSEGNIERLNLDIKISKKNWADRTLFKEILETYALLPITTDSHFGEYIPWASEIADHTGIKDFYSVYQLMLTEYRPKIELNRSERAVLILEGLITDSGYEEPAINILNNGLIPSLPDWIAVEVPGIITKNGIKGIGFPNYPKGIAALLRNYCGVYDLVAEAIVTQKKDYVIQAILANPIVNTYRNVRELTDFMIERQSKWLRYLT
ncbi:alpha-glucosidase [uncultured Sphaerochaeta sp.]|uniref:family 4 glycosyl hydrolase n=1 Tax=uncultured Sphaerochaeta sp. TaxID=886478 RepID=UPI002AA838A9|nr:alpha-glucosidase [uncultured Sphaerochaeta sp.]